MNREFFSNSGRNNAVKDVLENKLVKYGNPNYAYIVLNKRNLDSILIISNIMDYFTDVYLENKYQSIDPVIINAMNRVSPVFWDESLMINSQWTINKIFNSVKPYYNIISGQTYVLHDQNNNLALLSLYINNILMQESYDSVKNQRDELQGVLIQTHEMLLHLYRQEDNNIIDNKNLLSRRESEILYWCSIGKTYPEIAIILDITVSTVKFHTGNIVKKLGVNNVKHAISLSLELNIIAPPAGKGEKKVT